MTDYLNPHKLYPDDISRRIDIPPGFDSVRPAVKESLTTALDENGLVRCGCGGEPIECGAKNKSDWRYKCQVCGIETASQPNNDWAIHVWNCAMGYKGADE